MRFQHVTHALVIRCHIVSISSDAFLTRYSRAGIRYEPVTNALCESSAFASSVLAFLTRYSRDRKRSGVTGPLHGILKAASIQPFPSIATMQQKTVKTLQRN